MIRLGVNIDHIATLREVRKATYPNLIEATFLCEQGGADQITVHLREDRRHIQDHDVDEILKHSRLPLNLEMALVPEIISKACAWKPYSVTLVPERRAEMTTESGIDLNVVKKKQNAYKKLAAVTRVYAFIDPESEQVKLAKSLGFQGVEFHTGPFAHAYEQSLRGRGKGKISSHIKEEVQRLERACLLASREGLEVKIGHGLTVQNVFLLLGLQELEEANIGHAIVARAVMVGLEAAVREMKQALNSKRSLVD